MLRNAWANEKKIVNDEEIQSELDKTIPLE